MRPTLYFFKMFQCGACTAFEERIFQQLVQDPEVLQAVNIEKVSFGRGEDGTSYTINEEFPDFKEKVAYAPYLWLANGYDEEKGYHLSPSTMNDKSMNTRIAGKEFQFQVDTTYEDFKQWLLASASSAGSASFRSSRRR